MNRGISIALLVVGVILLVFAWQSSQSLASDVSETIHGTPTDRTVWYLVGGALLAIAGLVGLLRAPRSVP